jgi:Flp pilus assembly protein TadB
VSSRFVVPLSRLLAWGQPHPGEQGAGAPQRLGPWGARQRYHRALFLVIGFWAVVTCVAAAVFPLAAIVVALAGLAHVIAGYRVEQRRRAEQAAPVRNDR